MTADDGHQIEATKKAKKDKQALKRRDITSFSTDVTSQVPAKDIGLILEEIIKGMNSSHPVLCFQVT